MCLYNKVSSQKRNNILGVIATEILLNIVIFQALTHHYVKNIISGEDLKTLSSLGNHSGPGYVNNFKLK